jgi:transcriptional antiterminator RfaH
MLTSPAIAQPARIPPSPVEGAWYACYTRPRSEKKVALLFGERGIENFLPTAPRVSQWHDRKRTVHWPLFASYVFARTCNDELPRIFRTPRVVDVVRFCGRPALIPDSEIRNIASFADALAATGYEPPPAQYEEGQRVRITAGPFEDVEGVVVELRGRKRVLVGLAAIGAGFEVDVPAHSLKAIR